MVIITEDIIRKSLDESINEFMINEVQWGKAIGKVGNFLKNAAATYMDFMTDGRWNAKYGIYNNSTGMTTEIYYLNQWFNWHLEQIQRLEERKVHPNDDSYRERTYKKNAAGEKIYTEVEDQYDSVEAYANANINADNFNEWIGNRIKNRLASEIIDNYLNKVGKLIKDSKTAANYLNAGAFYDYASKEGYFNKSTYGNRSEYAKRKAEERSPKALAKKEGQLINNFFTDLAKQYNAQASKNSDNLGYFIKYNLEGIFEKYFGYYQSNRNAYNRVSLVKKYVYDLWNTFGYDSSYVKSIGSEFNYKSFINSNEGKEYWYLIRQYLSQSTKK